MTPTLIPPISHLSLILPHSILSSLPITQYTHSTSSAKHLQPVPRKLLLDFLRSFFTLTQPLILSTSQMMTPKSILVTRTVRSCCQKASTILIQLLLKCYHYHPNFDDSNLLNWTSPHHRPSIDFVR